MSEEVCPSCGGALPPQKIQEANRAMAGACKGPQLGYHRCASYDADHLWFMPQPGLARGQSPGLMVEKDAESGLHWVYWGNRCAGYLDHVAYDPGDRPQSAFEERRGIHFTGHFTAYMQLNILAALLDWLRQNPEK